MLVEFDALQILKRMDCIAAIIVPANLKTIAAMTS